MIWFLKLLRRWLRCARRARWSENDDAFSFFAPGRPGRRRRDANVAVRNDQGDRVFERAVRRFEDGVLDVNRTHDAHDGEEDVDGRRAEGVEGEFVRERLYEDVRPVQRERERDCRTARVLREQLSGDEHRYRRHAKSVEEGK